MDMQGSRTLAVTQQQAWEALNDPEMLKACIPGCEKFELTEANTYAVTTAVKIGPVSARFNGRVQLSDIVPPNSYKLGFDAQGGVAGFGKGEAAVQLAPAGTGCELSYTVHSTVGGKIAQLGQRLIDGAAITRLEPRVVARCALRSPESGIVDVHGLCQSYVAEAQAFGASFAYHTEVVGFAPRGDGYQVDTRRGDARFSVRAGAVVNAAGLASDRVAAMAGVDVDARGWRIRPCKGDYFAIAPRLGRLCQRLVYPLPTAAGLGVHVTMDLGGAFRAGPDTEYLDAESSKAPRYDVDPSKAARFGSALRRYLPEVRDEDLSPDYAGVRPKLYGPGEPKRDFVLEETPARVVHLVGIESPGITASEALARRVLARL